MSPPAVAVSETTPLLVVDNNKESSSHSFVCNGQHDYDWAALQCNIFSTVMGITQLVLVALFAIGTTYNLSTTEYSLAEYIIFRDIMVMLLLGFGYLMTFLKKYGLGAVGLTLLLSTLAIELNVIVELFCRFIFKWMTSGEVDDGEVDDSSNDDNDTIFPLPLTMATLIDGEFAAATLLISFGAIIGRASPLQLYIMTLCQSLAYAANKVILIFGFIQAEDVGGSMTIHMFGAYFGLAVSHVLGPPKVSSISNSKPNVTSDLTALIGTTLLWVYWPSFVGATETAVPENESFCVLHTILALIGSTGAAFFFSLKLSHDGKIDPIHVANSTLAGGVAVGSSARMAAMTPVGALLLGIVAGTVSVYGYVYSTPAFEKCTLKIYDTCGVGNLHGWPSIVGGLSSIIFVLISDNETTEDFLIHGTGINQCLAQVLGVVCTLIISMSSGYLTGIIMKKVGSSSDDSGDDGFDEYDDAIWWEGEYFENTHHTE